MSAAGGGREAPALGGGGSPLPVLTQSTHQAMRWKLAGSCSVMLSGRVTPSSEPTLSTSSCYCPSALAGTLTMEASSTSRMLTASAPPRWECAQGHMVPGCSRLSSLGGGCCHHSFHGGRDLGLRVMNLPSVTLVGKTPLCQWPSPFRQRVQTMPVLRYLCPSSLKGALGDS